MRLRKWTSFFSFISGINYSYGQLLNEDLGKVHNTIETNQEDVKIGGINANDVSFESLLPTSTKKNDIELLGLSPSGTGIPVACTFRYTLPAGNNLQASKKKTGNLKDMTTIDTDGSGSSGTSTNVPTTTTVDPAITKSPKSSTPSVTPKVDITKTTKAPTEESNDSSGSSESPAPPLLNNVAPSRSRSNPRRHLVDKLVNEEKTETPTLPTLPTLPTPLPTDLIPKVPEVPTTTVAGIIPTTSPSLSGSGLNDDTLPSDGSSLDSTNAPVGSITTGQFTCDETFYGAWKLQKIRCKGKDLDVSKAVTHAQCMIHSGSAIHPLVDSMEVCMSVCSFPKCNEKTGWDYTATDGISSPVYSKLNFIQFMSAAGAGAAVQGLTEAYSVPFANLTLHSERECIYKTDESFVDCTCNVGNLFDNNTEDSKKTKDPAFTVPVDKGLGDSDHWADGVPKKPIEKAGSTGVTIGSSAATASVAMGGLMTVAGGAMGGTSAGVATGVTAGASVGITIAAIDLCQFSVMINQMNLDARPRLVEEMGKQMSPSGFTFLPFGKLSTEEQTTERRLQTNGNSSGSNTGDVTAASQGMEKYAKLIGVDVNFLFYLTCGGLIALVAIVFVLYAFMMLLCVAFVKDFRTFSSKWFDKSIGVLTMILILSEYAIGVTATFQICWCIEHDEIDARLFLAIFALLFFAIGTICYGFYVVGNYEDELRDLGTKDHFEKKVHNRYGPLYNEYKFESRFFFAPKLLLALLSGATAGMVFLSGLTQIVILLTLHVLFLFYLEVKHPYPTQFVQKATTFVIIIKILALCLSFFLIASATSLHEEIPLDLREGVGFAIIGLQVLVLICLLVRQVYIIYITWKLKKSSGKKKSRPSYSQNFVALGDNWRGATNFNQEEQVQYEQQQHQYFEQQPPHNDTQHQANQYRANRVPSGVGAKLRGLQVQQPPPSRTHSAVRQDQYNPTNQPQARQHPLSRTHSVVRHDQYSSQNQQRPLVRTHSVVKHDTYEPANPPNNFGGEVEL